MLITLTIVLCYFLKIIKLLNISNFYFINNTLQNNFLNYLLPLITDVCSVITLSIIFILLYVIGEKKIKKIAIFCLLGLLLTKIFVFILKISIAEPRPFLVLNHVHKLIPEIRY